jgi:DNA-binding response OmpR family regulator
MEQISALGSHPLHSQTNAQKTVFVVDHNPDVRDSIAAFLTNSGYTVLSAAGGSEAVHQSLHHEGVIHLLLAAFQMPEMSGMHLAAELSRQRPDIQVLLMSSFTDGMLILNEGWHFLHKPFFPSQLGALITGLVSPGRVSRFAV